ncbi:hypothetical protein HD553DRAFT_306867 [Filobasidium floriforme]|uniref:uncharacterized protein n=1 Tax=Filobasidium floriforme TaxID=5210 RepID=UPI001E8D1824|nr:uncharacterized protein HD553DRAFT_306867 [Filobasidium floriforme]KAH8087916.1 hypothetical protein HD553DRAFT_306867 [Filobasidium floriforme]
MSTADLLLPGQPLPAKFNSTPTPQPGSGCYLSPNGKLVASIVGVPVREGSIVSVKSRHEMSAVPEIGAIVIGTISRLTPLQANLTISLVSSRPTPQSQEDFQGLIKLSDVRLTEKDKLKMGECFRLGDVVRAEVLSLGDARSYFLSTAANHLGVISATSAAGNPLTPVSWQEMQDTVTGEREKRKVAKPDDA